RDRRGRRARPRRVAEAIHPRAEDPMSAEHIRVERDGPVTTVLIDRPAARNACTVAMVKALHDAFMAFEADPDARVAVLAGTGGAFCAGADLKELASGAAIGFSWA